MKRNIKIIHNTVEVKGNYMTSYYILISEVCITTGKILVTYSCLLPIWVHEELYSEYEFYQPVFN